MAIIKCGSCSQFHKTVAEVRECFNREKKVPTVEVNRPKVPATDKQKAFVSSLLKDRVWDGEPFEVELLTKDEASGIIGKLKNAPVKATKQTHIVVGTVSVPTQGKFTVVWPTGDRRTYRFKIPKEGNFRGKVLVGYLAGPENDSDYIHFGNNISPLTIRVWSRYTEESMLVEGLRFLLSSNEAQLKAGEMYAIQSGNCWRCGRTLTVPASVARGLGPICAELLGVA
jgi:hypothetical protein